MSKILVLAESGFGKSSSLGEISGLGIKGLDPKKTLIIACSDKGLPFRGWRNKYTKIQKDKSTGEITGNYLSTNDPSMINKTIDIFLKERPDIEYYVVDDINFIMQDYYMENAKNKGFATFQNIGYDVGQMFKRFDNIHKMGKTIIALGHPEYYEVNGVHKVKLKTVGQMVDQYVTPVAKFDVLLMGHEENDERHNKLEKKFVTGYVNDSLKGKAPYGMFEDVYIPNDLGFVVDKVVEYETADS